MKYFEICLIQHEQCDEQARKPYLLNGMFNK
jgi:hypothetical protein